ncbi:hypothetical protein, partial [Spirosoma flavum]
MLTIPFVPYRLFYVVLSLLLAGAGRPTALAQPRIFNAPPATLPGQAISLQGNFTANANAFLLAGTSTTPVPLPILTQTLNHLTARIPTTLSQDLFQVWIEDAGQRSPAVLINQATGFHLDSPQAPPGGTLRVFGRNLLLSGATPLVRLIPTNGGPTLQATINLPASDAYQLSLTLPPTLQPGTTYSLWLSNGRGGAA